MMVDDFLMEAMICPICRMVFQAPEQLQCGHSFCSTCIGRLCQAFVFSDRFPTCPLCRMRITEKPVSNYTLSSLISRLKEKESMSKKCVQCSKMLTSEEQFSCDDCDHADREENVRCTLCIIEKHAKIGHSISKYGDTKQLINSAQEELKVILKKTTQFLEDCRRVTRERFDVINELFKRTAEFSQFVDSTHKSLSDFLVKTSIELATHVLCGEVANNKAGDSSRSWFGYEREGRVGALYSAAARRNAILARRHAGSCSTSMQEVNNDEMQH